VAVLAAVVDDTLSLRQRRLSTSAMPQYVSDTSLRQRCLSTSAIPRYVSDA